MPTPTGYFYLSPALANGNRDTGTEVKFVPAPSYVDYGDRIVMTRHETDAKLIVQRSAKNPKVKKWVWVGYTPIVPRYEAQYEIMFRHQQHIREDVFGESPYVYLKETVTNVWGMYSSGVGNLVADWARCRIINVDRTLPREGGYVKYPETTIEFTIDDTNFTVV